MTLRVARLGPDDWREHRELRLESLRSAPEAFAMTYEESLLMTDAEWRDRMTGAVTFWQARDDGEPLGMAGLWEDADDGPGVTAYLIAMFVRPRSRRRGIGAVLVQTVVDEASSRGHGRLVLHVETGNETALRLYERAGFVATGPPSTHPHRAGLLEQPMVRRLYEGLGSRSDG